MRHLHQLPLSAAMLAMALAISLPSMADARPEGSGKHDRGRSSEVRGGQPGKRREFRGGDQRVARERGHNSRVTTRERGDWRGSGGRGARPREDVRYREPSRAWRPDARADARWRDSDRRRDDRSYASRVRYRDGGSYDSRHRTRWYYTGSFHRPRFVYRSGFSLGVVIGSVAPYGYRYFDPYCDRGFHDLDLYYDHCHYHDHPSAILVLDFRSGYPIASCAYDGGYWVVDDCY